MYKRQILLQRRYFQLDIIRKLWLIVPSLEQYCRLTFDPHLYFNPEAMPIYMKPVSYTHLPIGIQNFESLRNDGYFYIDKTALIYQLVKTGDVYKRQSRGCFV